MVFRSNAEVSAPRRARCIHPYSDVAGAAGSYKKLGIAGRVLLFFCLLPSASYGWAETLAATTSTVSLTILHTNDTHSQLLPFSYPTAERGLAGLETRANIGGAARRATLVKKLRRELEAQGRTVWVMDAGDFSDGSPFSIEYKGEADIAVMNAIGYTLGALGNHEFNYTRAQLQKLLSLCQFPVIDANITDRKTGAALTKEYVQLAAGPLKVGIFGLLTAGAASYPAAREGDGLKISGELTAARRLTRQLAGQADVVMLLSHCGENKDREIAAKVPGIAVIIGGHSHSRLPLGLVVPPAGPADPAYKDKPELAAGTIIVQAHHRGGELGRLDLEFTRDTAGHWRITRHQAALLPITPDIPADPQVAAIIARYWQPIAAKYTEVIGRATADFVDRGEDLPSYNLMADALRASYGADFALENMGGVRAALLAGDITADELAALDPFGNTVITFSMHGSRLRRILATRQPAVSGIKYRVENKTLVAATIGGQPLDDNKIYRGVTNSYFAPIILKGISFTNTGRQRLDVLTDYIRRQKTITPLYDSRRVVK